MRAMIMIEVVVMVAARLGAGGVVLDRGAVGKRHIDREQGRDRGSRRGVSQPADIVVLDDVRGPRIRDAA